MQSSRLSQQLQRVAHALGGSDLPTPRVGLVLGSGLGEFADSIAERRAIPYESIEGMAPTAVAGHSGNLVFGNVGSTPIVAMQGRLHLYEGHAPERVVFGARLMITLGARVLILTNAAGGISDRLEPGTLMLIDDHLNLTSSNPLHGPNDDALGARFPDMSEAYDPELRALARGAAQDLGCELHSGVYAGVLGPSYETPAEVRMLRSLGADAVGMSTVLEVIAARHMGARCLGISFITNYAAGLSAEPLDHADVQRVADQGGRRFSALLGRIVSEL